MSQDTPVAEVDVAALPPWERHRGVLRHFDALAEHQVIRLTGGRELATVQRMLSAERSGLFHWQWTETGPDRWTAYVERLPEGSLFTVLQDDGP